MMRLCHTLGFIIFFTVVYAMQRKLLSRKHQVHLSHTLGLKYFHLPTSAIRAQNGKAIGMGSPKFYSDSSLRYVLDREAHSGLPDRTKPFTVLGIESSCDDTGVAVVRSDGTILSQVVYSQNAIHEKFGGIVPTLAMEQHKLNIDVAVAEALEKAGMQSANEVDAIAVTKGPGLEICLRVGLRKAQALASEYRKPFVTVHHLEAHCMLARLAGQVPQMVSTAYTPTSSMHDNSNKHTPAPDATTSQQVDTNKQDAINHSKDTATAGSELPHFTPKVAFPFLVLLASGGHTSLLLCTDLGEYTVLGGTLDDALGEAFDKAARLLGLRGASSGGVAIEQAAERYNANATAMANANAQTHAELATATSSSMKAGHKSVSGSGASGSGGAGAEEEAEVRSGLNVPMRNKANCDFSYAGLKTSFRKAVERARLAQGYNETLRNASNAPASQHAEAPSPVTLPEDVTGKLCADFQDTAFAHVEDRLKRALDYVDHQHIPVTSLVVVGGVAANGELRRRLWALLKMRADKHKATLLESGTATATSTSASAVSAEIALVFPPPALCTDNGVMVAWTAIEKLSRGYSDSIEEQNVVPRWPMGTPLSAQDKEVLGSLKRLSGKNKNEKRANRRSETYALEKLLRGNTML